MKSGLKAACNLLAVLLVLPAVLVYRAGAPVLGAEKAFVGWPQALSLVPGLTGVYLRRAFYCLTLPACAWDVFVGFGVLLSHPGARLGRGVYVGPYCCLGEVTIGDDVLLGSHVSITSGMGQHGIDRTDVPIRMQPGVRRRVTIGQDSWIGERSVVMADVGRHCVIGAGSVVTRAVPDFAIATGAPARVIRYRDQAQEDRAQCPPPE